MRITQDTTLYEIATLDRFAEFSDQIIFARNKSVTIRDLNRFAPDWITSDIAEGFQHLYDTGARCVRPYTARARKGDPSLERVLLFDFSLDEPVPFVVLCAGGGYGEVASMVEAFPSARRLNELGCSAFVLQYRAGAYGGREKPLDDLACAVRYILDNARNMGVRSDAYAVCGYSAGGHLAACFGTEALGWKKYDLPAPGVIWLSYPVITMGPNAHRGSRKNFLRDMAEDPDARKQYSPDLFITPAYPATYIWHCEHDREVIPKYNALAMERALLEQGVPCLRETFPGSSHGWGRAGGTAAQHWLEHALKFRNAHLQSH